MPDAPTPQPPAVPEETSIEWKWYDPRCKRDIAVPKQLAIAVYINQNDDIVIRQEDDLYDEEREGFIWIRRENLLALINKLTEIHRSFGE